jgi:hypothetical protein
MLAGHSHSAININRKVVYQPSLMNIKSFSGVTQEIFVLLCFYWLFPVIKADAAALQINL